METPKRKIRKVKIAEPVIATVVEPCLDSKLSGAPCLDSKLSGAPCLDSKLSGAPQEVVEKDKKIRTFYPLEVKVTPNEQVQALACECVSLDGSGAPHTFMVSKATLKRFQKDSSKLKLSKAEVKSSKLHFEATKG